MKNSFTDKFTEMAQKKDRKRTGKGEKSISSGLLTNSSGLLPDSLPFIHQTLHSFSQLLCRQKHVLNTFGSRFTILAQGVYLRVPAVPENFSSFLSLHWRLICDICSFTSFFHLLQHPFTSLVSFPHPILLIHLILSRATHTYPGYTYPCKHTSLSFCQHTIYNNLPPFIVA